MAESREEDRLTLILDWPEISPKRLSTISGLWAELLREVSRQVAGRTRGPGVRWLLAAVKFGSPLELTVGPTPLRPDIDPAVIRQISKSVMSGLSDLVVRPERPTHFSDAVLSRIRKLAKEADVSKDRQIYIANGDAHRIAVGPEMVSAVDDLFGPTVESYGSIEGRIEGIFVHAAHQIYVYDSLTNRQVRCDFGDRVPLDEVLQAFAKRVAVTGMIKSRARTAAKLSVKVSALRVFRGDAELPRTQEILDAWRQG